MSEFIPGSMSLFASMITSGAGERELFEDAIDDIPATPVSHVDTDKPFVSFCEVADPSSFNAAVEQLSRNETTLVLHAVDGPRWIAVATACPMDPETMENFGIKLREPRFGFTNPFNLTSKQFRNQISMYRMRVERALESIMDTERTVRDMEDQLPQDE